MENTSQLARKFFNEDVKFSGGISAKWKNNNHPENPNFQQTVYWVALLSGANVIINYTLRNGADARYLEYHCTLPVVESFESTVFNYWVENF